LLGGTGSSDQTPPQGFSLGRFLQLVGWRQASDAESSLIPKEVLQLGQVVNSAVAQASQLNINDPPEVTRQKAQAILESLKPWDSTLAAGRSVGLVNDETAGLLNSYVGQLKAEVQKLVQYMPTPETIVAVQQLAANLQATVGPLMAMFGTPTASAPTTAS